MDGCCGDFKFTLEEAEDGFRIHIIGDKEALRPKLEAMEAYWHFQEKAKAAGWNFGHRHWQGMMHGHHGMHHGGDKLKKFMTHLHKSFQEAMNDMKKD